MNRALTITLLLCGHSVAVVGQHKDKAPCRVFFLAVEQDEATVNLKMVGLNQRQSEWYRKEGNQKDYGGVCVAPVNTSGEQIPLESVSEDYINRVIRDAPLYMVAWEQHQVFVPDNNGGHYAFSSNGTLSRWDGSKPDGKNFVPVGPIHNTNRTILTSSSVSLLKEAIRQIRRKEGL